MLPSGSEGVSGQTFVSKSRGQTFCALGCMEERQEEIKTVDVVVLTSSDFYIHILTA